MDGDCERERHLQAESESERRRHRSKLIDIVEKRKSVVALNILCLVAGAKPFHLGKHTTSVTTSTSSNDLSSYPTHPIYDGQLPTLVC